MYEQNQPMQSVSEPNKVKGSGLLLAIEIILLILVSYGLFTANQSGARNKGVRNLFKKQKILCQQKIWYNEYMTINIHGVGIELSEAIREYVEKKLSGLEKFVSKNEDIFADVEIGKTTNHHKQGEVFKAEINFSFSGKKFNTLSIKEDLYKAIDEVKQDLEYQIIQSKEKGDTLFRRGARSIKKIMKGISKRNPFSSKY